MVRNLIHRVLERILTYYKGDNPNLGAKIRPQTDLREIEKNLFAPLVQRCRPQEGQYGYDVLRKGIPSKGQDVCTVRNPRCTNCM
jgi:hypothetical protein